MGRGMLGCIRSYEIIRFEETMKQSMSQTLDVVFAKRGEQREG